MSPRIRKLALTSHVTFSVGWLGAVLAYLVVAVAGLTSLDLQLVKGTYMTMQLMAWFVIVPCAIAALLSGLVIAMLRGLENAPPSSGSHTGSAAKHSAKASSRITASLLLCASRRTARRSR